MKKFLLIITTIFISLNYPAQSIDLPKYYQFPENYLKGKYHESTKDFFIVATNKLKDSRFKKAVIVMLEHDNKGALGVVINKPLGNFKIGSLIKDLNIDDTDKKELYDFEVPIYWGGPLDNNKLLILHSSDYKNQNTKNYKDISITNDYKALLDIAQNKGPKKKLVILGVSAWNLGQLEGEIDKGHWNLSEINENILFEKNNENKHIIATKNSFVRL
jgi:putative transcriptional regulator